MKKGKSKNQLIKENRELTRLADFINRELLHCIPHRVLSDILAECYDGKLNPEQFLGACRFMDYLETEFMRNEYWKKYTNDIGSGRYFFTKWAREIDAPTLWQVIKVREKKEKDLAKEKKDYKDTHE